MTPSDRIAFLSASVERDNPDEPQELGRVDDLQANSDASTAGKTQGWLTRSQILDNAFYIATFPAADAFLLLYEREVAGSHPFKAKTIGRAHTDAGLGLHLYGRCGSAIDPSGYAASQT
jgi:hypothetical protein